MTQKKHLTEEDLSSVMDLLPRFANLAAATSGGILSGGYFILTGQLLGLSPLNYLVQKP